MIPLNVSQTEVIDRLRGAGCVFAEDETSILVSSARDAAELLEMVRLRERGRPLEHVVGWAEFHGIRVLVDPGVFVPRRRTEFLVDRAVALTGDDAVVVDLCCGSGAIGLAVAALRHGVDLHLSDVEPAAVRCAQRNATPAGAAVHQGDLFEALPSDLRGGVDVLLANVPYVPSAEIEFLPREARGHEPVLTLDGGGHGLDVLRRVAATALEWLAPHGHLFVEVSENQARPARAIAHAEGMRAWTVTCQELGATVLIATPPA
ncbi:putative protein N(5)-glutamine methyltransferase [Spiractinospora alimapuensis]|uniref:putative protein N(5)-glutamine methyltransferase n=1 Tax=Spiractinospora alimapuensis TaxID=2820884 RepID=UPI001F33ABF1|nr:putative protein N(5)-glutamine methyltransferase [Spiractinospora alimapuensis]QVQ52729.1 putative protein N(5)-glutamine methyltransferase [Spiractinospora alimapuensis]